MIDHKRLAAKWQEQFEVLLRASQRMNGPVPIHLRQEEYAELIEICAAVADPAFVPTGESSSFDK